MQRIVVSYMLAVVWLLVTIFYGYMAFMGTTISISLLLIFITNHGLADINVLHFWLLVISIGGLLGLSGFWGYLYWRIRSHYRLTIPSKYLSVLLIIGICADLGLLLPAIPEIILGDVHLFQVVLIGVAFMGLYAVLDLKKPNNRLQIDAAAPRA